MTKKREWNGDNELLKQWQRLLEGEEDIPSRTTNKMLLAAHIDTRISVAENNEHISQLAENVDKLVQAIEAHINDEGKHVPQEVIDELKEHIVDDDKHTVRGLLLRKDVLVIFAGVVFIIVELSHAVPLADLIKNWFF